MKIYNFDRTRYVDVTPAISTAFKVGIGARRSGDDIDVRDAGLTTEGVDQLIDALLPYSSKGDTLPENVVTHAELVKQTFDFPQGCEAQKIRFLEEFGIYDPKSLLPKPVTITVEAQYHREGDHWEGLDGCSYYLREIGLEPKRMVSGSAAKDSWAKWECEVSDGAEFLKTVGGLGQFEYDHRASHNRFRIRGNVTLTSEV